MNLTIIGRAERVTFPGLTLGSVPARIDTGAKTSSIWATQVKEENGTLSFVMFGKSNPFYNGQKIVVKRYETRVVSSSNGVAEERYVVKLLVKIKSRQIRASFSLANRSSQVYPILIGRNVLRGKFIVDVKEGKPHTDRERKRSAELSALRRKI